MKRLLPSFLALMLAACAGPPAEVIETAGEGVAEEQLSQPMSASKVTDEPSQLLVADFLLVDKSERLLIAYAEGRPIRAYPGIQFGDAPQGHKQFEGDEKTPEGRYSIDWRNPESRFHLSLHISYPNDADRAFAAQRGRSPGGNIFIHGQPNQLPYGRMPGDWTDGCIALSNAEIEELWRLVPDGTVIEIRP